MVIPLGTYPRWLLGTGFHAITLTVQNPQCVKEMTASNLEFLHLKPL
jgi:hypothetical protein